MLIPYNFLGANQTLKGMGVGEARKVEIRGICLFFLNMFLLGVFRGRERET